LRELKPWNTSCSVGHSILDEQHKKLHGILEKLIAASNGTTRSEREEFHALLNDLSFIARIHFDTEEAILAQHGFPLLEEHAELHAGCLSELADFLMKAALGTSTISELSNLIVEWWEIHTMVDDAKFIPYLAG
jgi:hemerythrin